MEKDFKSMSNSEIKLHMASLENEFESTKAKIKSLCETMDEMKSEYQRALEELKIRKNIYL